MKLARVHTTTDTLWEGDLSADGAPIEGDIADWLPPIARPHRILCIGLNYAAHAAESDRPADMQHPTVFTRFPSSLVGHLQPLVRPHVSTSYDWEGELGVVIGTAGRYISRDTALTHVRGYTCVMEGTLRDFQRHTSQFIPGKNFERSGAIGPWIVSTDDVTDPQQLTLTTRVNGEVMQQASTSDMLFSVAELIAYCSTFTTLEPGDIIATGTPAGVGYARTPPRFLQAGDVVEVEIESVGTLRNQVTDET